MELSTLEILEKLSTIYEDLDIDSVEKRFFSMVEELFSFDRIAFFYVKHRKAILKGKLSWNFPAGLVDSIAHPLQGCDTFITPFLTGDPVIFSTPPAFLNGIGAQLGLSNFALVPVCFGKNESCWEMKKCLHQGCPAYGSRHIRCWYIDETKCCNPQDILLHSKPERCANCSIFNNSSMEDVEGILLVDNSPSGNIIERAQLTALAIIGQTVARAVYNAKLFRKALDDAIRDPLTGLYNRRHFHERLQDEINRVERYGGHFSIILCDIDHFKKVNDDHGHMAGDAVLSWAAAILRDKSRQSDIVVRYGGEEFVILLVGTDAEKAAQVAEKLRLTFDGSTFFYGSTRICLTMSFGVTSTCQDCRSESPDALLEKADRALYAAKLAGRNRVVIA